MSMEFEAAYEQHYDKLFTMAFRMTGNREDAEDALQTAFLQAYSAWESFRGESSVGTWLFRILHNAALRHLSHRERMPMTEYAEDNGIEERSVFEQINSYGLSEDAALTAMVRESCLQMFMTCMPSRYRSVFTLRSILDFSVRETAEILEISESSVKVYLHRARKVARHHMEEKCSLVKDGAMCSCRSFASYVQAAGKTNRVVDMAAIVRQERETEKEYREELDTILNIEELYRGPLQSENKTQFMEHLKEMKREGRMKLLGAESAPVKSSR